MTRMDINVAGNNIVVGDGHVSGLDIAGDNGELSGSDLTAGHGEVRTRCYVGLPQSPVEHAMLVPVFG